LGDRFGHVPEQWRDTPVQLLPVTVGATLRVVRFSNRAPRRQQPDRLAQRRRRKPRCCAARAKLARSTTATKPSVRQIQIRALCTNFYRAYKDSMGFTNFWRILWSSTPRVTTMSHLILPDRLRPISPLTNITPTPSSSASPHAIVKMKAART
jgi:hypothetical protein